MSKRLDDVFDEYRDVPIAQKETLADEYAEALRKTGEMSEEEIEEEIWGWKNYDEQAELMRMYGADSEDELNDLMESNDVWDD